MPDRLRDSAAICDAAGFVSRWPVQPHGLRQGSLALRWRAADCARCFNLREAAFQSQSPEPLRPLASISPRMRPSSTTPAGLGHWLASAPLWPLLHALCCLLPSIFPCSSLVIDYLLYHARVTGHASPSPRSTSHANLSYSRRQFCPSRAPKRIALRTARMSFRFPGGGRCLGQPLTASLSSCSLNLDRCRILSAFLHFAGSST